VLGLLLPGVPTGRLAPSQALVESDHEVFEYKSTIELDTSNTLAILFPVHSKSPQHVWLDSLKTRQDGVEFRLPKVFQFLGFWYLSHRETFICTNSISINRP
jgi:UDP-N-acetylglucosamine 2-epimerase